MKRLIAMALLAGALSSCTMSNEIGECQGLATEDEQDPRFQYKLSKWNIVLGVIFVETLAVPVLIGAFWLRCPVGLASPPDAGAQAK